jgi:hypothetical protein
MENYQERGCREMALKITENRCFARSVETGSRFVQNENARLLQNYPRNGKPLTLAVKLPEKFSGVFLSAIAKPMGLQSQINRTARARDS